MKLLFTDLAKKHLTPERIQEFNNWIENANKAEESRSLRSKDNQYDKAEELITFYTFAPLELREDRREVVQQILALGGIKEHVEEPLALAFEKQLEPPKSYLEWLARKQSEHPIRYVREQGREHARAGKPLETNTHVDVVLEAKNLLILVEVKFTSDISYQTTFNAHRNQLARTVDAGISRLKKDQRLVVLLCSPSEFYRKKSRLYYYKLQEYTDFSKIKDDIVWRELPDIQKHLLSVAWVPLEKAIEAVYSFLKTQYSLAINKVRGVKNVASYVLYNMRCLVLNREAAENLRRPDKAISPTYFNT
jgi:hypothetical protein